MTCFIAQNELSAFADDALEMARAAELQDHLSGCAKCTRELQEIRRIRTMLRTLPVHRAPADFLSKVTAKAQRKSFLERASAALAPVLQLPRPAQASLALAASLLIAVTVFWNNPNRGLSDLRSAPGASAGFREVANVQATTADAEDSKPLEDLEKEAKLADAAELPQAELDRLQPVDKQTSLKTVVAQSAPPPPPVAEESSVRADKGLAAAGRTNEVSQGALALSPAATPAPIGGAASSSSGRGAGAGAATGSSAYTAPTSAGLYASEPAPAPVAAARPKNDLAKKPQAIPAKDLASSGASVADEDAHSEPSFDSSGAFGQTGSGATAGAGDEYAGGDMGASPDPFAAAAPAEEKSKTRDAREFAGKKEARRERGAAKAGEANAPALAEAPAEPEEVETVPAAVAAPAPAAPTVSAKYLSAASGAPAEIVSAAKAAGGRVISPTSTPPGLGKVGASTVVIVEIPASGVTAFEDALRLGGTLERGTLPSGAVRYRIEVVRQ